jgi:hypothetical protein
MASPPPEEPVGDVRQLPLAKTRDLPTTTVPKDKYDTVVQAVQQYSDELAGQRRALATMNRQLEHARKRIEELENYDDGIEGEIAYLLDVFREGRPDKKIVKTTLRKHGSRYKLMTVAVRKHGKENCEKAIVGNAKFPFNHFGRWLAHDPGGATRRDDLKDVFGDDERFERFVRLADDEPGKPPEKPANVDLTPWLTVWRANRIRIVRYLERRYGPGISDGLDGGGRHWPCPKCDDGPNSITLWVAGDRGIGTIARCTQCHLDDFRMILAMAKRERERAERDAPSG